MRGVTRLILLAAALGWGAPGAAQAQAGGTPAPAGGIECVYARLPAAEADALGKGYATDTIPMEQIAARVSPLIQACVDAGAITSQPQVATAFEYTMLRLEADQDVAFLRSNGVDPDEVIRLYPGLDTAMIALLEKAELSEEEKGRLSLYLAGVLARETKMASPQRVRASLLLYNRGKLRAREAAFAAGAASQP